MRETISRRAPVALTEALGHSARDLAAGRISDAAAVQQEAKRMLEAFERDRANGRMDADTA